MCYGKKQNKTKKSWHEIGSAGGKKATILHKRSFPIEQISEEGRGDGYSDIQGKGILRGKFSAKGLSLTFIIFKHFYIIYKCLRFSRNITSFFIKTLLRPLLAICFFLCTHVYINSLGNNPLTLLHGKCLLQTILKV